MSEVASRKQLRRSAATFLTSGQIALLTVCVAAIVACAHFIDWHNTLTIAVAVITLAYVPIVGSKLLYWVAATGYKLPGYKLPGLDDPDLPTYTLLIPLRRESSDVVKRLVISLQRLQYPTDRMEVFLLVDENDLETRLVIDGIPLPSHFRIIDVPDVGPRTKPKACNYGYMQSRGERVVIYDAEDRPDPDQLLKAVAYFRYYEVHDQTVGCLQAKLSFWNPRTSWISSFYWGEYVVHYTWVLPGMARLHLIPPLGGTSNHFIAEALEAVAKANGPWKFTRGDRTVVITGPWDSYNLTEDADLAYRLAKSGYRIMMLDSVTYEGALSVLQRAKEQRGRWLQGYLHTGVVHTRRPVQGIRDVGLLPWLSYNLMMIGTPVSLVINPITWGATALYFAARGAGMEGTMDYMQSLFPRPIEYVGMVIAVLGNLLLYAQKILTAAQQQEHYEALPNGADHELGDKLNEQTYGLTWRLFFTPIFWAFTSVSAYRALRKILTPSQRSKWDKTDHQSVMDEESQLELNPNASRLPLPEVES